MKLDNAEELPRLTRRQVIKWFAATAAATQFAPLLSFGADPVSRATGYGTDPKVNAIYKPGDFWPLTLSRSEKETVIALADVILPEDHLGPAASSLRVHDYIDEWVSAPYPNQQASRKTVLPGLVWMDEESRRRFKKKFAALSLKQKKAICDDIADPDQSDPNLRKGATFFSHFAGLCMGAYYATPEGWKAVGYVGNTPMATFDGPPQEVLDRVGVVQTVT